MEIRGSASPRRVPPLVAAGALALASALVLVACGQLPNVRGEGIAFRGPGGENGFGEDGSFFDEDGVLDGANGAAGGEGLGPAAGPGAPGTAGGASTGDARVRGSDRTGVTDDAIHLGAHAPVTGAAPLPSRSFERAADLYWRWVTQAQGQKVLGRERVVLEFADDRYQPSSAIQVCRQLAQRVFALAGAGGTDQIQACARYANGARVPYSSAGVTERGLEDLEWYFAFSMTYRAQGELLAQYVRRNFRGTKVAAVITDTPNFDDARIGWERGVQRERLDYVRTYRHPKGDTSWYNTIARDFRNAGVDVLYMLTSPVDYIRFAQQASRQGFRPQYVGVGISMGLNPVLEAGCGDVDGGIFFSPFPGLDWARQNAPDFFTAAERFNTPRDDLAFGIWGQSKAIHETFKRYEATYGTDLTREDYKDLLSTQRNIRSGIFPPVSYSPDDRFGAGHVHVLKADCSRGDGEYVTLETFVNRF